MSADRVPSMQTFSDILKALPAIKTGQSIWVRRIFIGLLICAITFVILVALGWYLKRVTLIHFAYIPIFFAAFCIVGQIALEVRDYRRTIVDPAG
jgi:cobalamin biosynthesis protein CobD/CbiB